MANFGNPDLVMWRDAMDIPSTDPYPMFEAELEKVVLVVLVPWHRQLKMVRSSQPRLVHPQVVLKIVEE